MSNRKKAALGVLIYLVLIYCIIIFHDYGFGIVFACLSIIPTLYVARLMRKGVMTDCHFCGLENGAVIIHLCIDSTVKGKHKVKCPRCGGDVTENQFEHNSEVDGHIDIGYDCTKCQISVYHFKVELLEEE